MPTRPDKMPIYPSLFRDLLIAEVKRRLFDESMPRLRKCLEQLSEEEIWQRPNERSNSVGNLVLHLDGNIRQWIVSGLGGDTDTRQRQAEFDERGPISKTRLLDGLEATMKAVTQTLEQLRPEHLLEYRDVQTFRESGLSILVHAVEHFSYHVGQITYIVKARKDMDMGYYEGVDLE